MSVSPADVLAGILPVVVSGTRPLLTQRPTARFLAALHGVTRDPVWAVRDDEAGAYENDGHEIAAYPGDWAREWARDHWTDIIPFDGNYTGAFPGREHACRLAAERGCWGVLQLDDNITRIDCFVSRGAAVRVTRRHGGLALFADILAAVVRSTNAASAGAYLDAVNPRTEAGIFARTGFPYSLFIERADQADRPPWCGPCEDDIVHGFQYGTSAEPVTAAVVVPLRYAKESGSSKGLRLQYDARRSVGLQRMHPEGARVIIWRTKVNGQGGPRVFHKMTPDAIRTPLVVLDRELYDAAAAQMAAIAAEIADERRADIARRVASRAVAAGRT